MKHKILKFSTVILLFAFIGASCKKDEIEISDESIIIDNQPGISIYKIKGDYFNFISLQLLPDGRLNAIPDYTINSSRIIVSGDGKIKINTRWLLKNGFIVDKESSLRDVFTDITFQEYVDYNTANNTGGWPNELIKPRVIDENPYVEYYHLNGLNKREKKFTLGELNKMIEEGTLETVFEKLK